MQMRVRSLSNLEAIAAMKTHKISNLCVFKKSINPKSSSKQQPAILVTILIASDLKVSLIKPI